MRGRLGLSAQHPRCGFEESCTVSVAGVEREGLARERLDGRPIVGSDGLLRRV
jgi:hypothetical protein